jgi:hypothetical protein
MIPYAPIATPVQSARKSGGVPGWLAVVGLVLCFPAGIVLTLLTAWSVKAKAIAIGVIVAFAVVGGIAVASAPKSSPTASVATTSSPVTPAAQASAKSPAASAAPKPHFVTFGSGTLVVGKDVQPGTYRTRHDKSGCYFARLSGFGGTVEEIVANELANGPAVVTISPSDKGFQSNNCDTWSSDLSAITSSKTTFGAGDFIVGTDILPGTYQNTGSTTCYWARLSGFGHTIDEVVANDISSAKAVVTVAANDAGFESDGCGTWDKIG